MSRTLLSSAAVLLALCFAGCQSYEFVQSNIFSDDDGNIVAIDYGRSESDHVNTFRNPATGMIMEFKSKLVVRVRLPDDDTFTAWQGMNFMQAGTMYKTDNEEWMVLVTGFSCRVFLRGEENETQYKEVYRGILCESPKSDYTPNDKWRMMKKDSSGRWR